MTPHHVLAMATSGHATSPVLITIAGLMIVVGLMQAIRPQLLWSANRNMQRGWVRDPDGTEPTRKGYTVQRISGAITVVAALWILIANV